MTETFKKLNYKGQNPILVMGAPESFERELLAASSESEVHRSSQAGVGYAFLIAFAPMKEDLLTAAKTLLRASTPDAVIWFAYPKQSSKKLRSDLNRDICRETLEPLSIETVRQIAVDEDWSALRVKRTS
jgi:hypothetical protein